MKRSLSLKKQGQKKLNFAPKVQGQSAESSSAPPAQGAGPPVEEDALPAPSSASWLSGLCNLGNTCYANSILQVLRFCPQFSSKVMTLSQLLKGVNNGKGAVDHADTADDMECGSEDWQANKGALVIHLHQVSGQLST